MYQQWCILKWKCCDVALVLIYFQTDPSSSTLTTLAILSVLNLAIKNGSHVYCSICIVWKWRQLEPRCLRRQRDMPWERRKTLERVSSSRWVRGLGLVKEPQPARPKGRKEAIKRPESGLSAGHRRTFIVSWTRCTGDGKRQRKTMSERQKLRWK